MIKKFTGIDGRVAWALTHVDAVVGLKKILKDISGRINAGGLPAEDGSNVSIEDMEVGTMYIKDGKIYFKSTEPVGSDSAEFIGVSLGSNGISIIEYDQTLPDNYYYENTTNSLSWEQIYNVCFPDQSPVQGSQRTITSGAVYNVQQSIPTIVHLTQQEYDALNPPDANTIYLITEST